MSITLLSLRGPCARPEIITKCLRRLLATAATSNQDKVNTVHGQLFPRDDLTNVPPSILSKIGAKLHETPSHPIGILRGLIEAHFPSFQSIAPSSPAVSVYKNFDELGFAADHPGRKPSDSYYLNRQHMLRTHTSAHEVETFASGVNRWLLSADVYRRDEIDKSHYPVFHQMEGAYVLPSHQIATQMAHENEILSQRLSEASKQGQIIIDDPTKPGIPSNPWQSQHDRRLAEIVDKSLKLHLNSLVLSLFGPAQAMKGVTTQPLQVRWIEAFFPFTSPSYEVEVLFDDKWLEILGCGVVKQATLDRAGVPDKMGWAFGLGLERIAMVLFSIPDIRLFWSSDARFLSQFAEKKLSTFNPYSRYPACYKDISFWVPPAFHENDFCDVVRNVAGDLVSDVQKIDEFAHPKTQKRSMCYRINYQSMDRNLSNEEINVMQAKVSHAAVKEMQVELR